MAWCNCWTQLCRSIYGLRQINLTSWPFVHFKLLDTSLWHSFESEKSQSWQLLAAYFAPSYFCREGFLKHGNIFARKNTPSSSCFLIFLTLKIFWFFAKKPHNYGGKNIFRKYYHLVRILQQICHPQQFWKKFKFFSKNPTFERFEKSYHFSRILRQICYNLVKKLHVQKRMNIVNPIGKHRVKTHHLSGRFSSLIL